MHIHLIKKQTINYPSGSAMEFYNNILYIIGDDVNYILCLDEAWKEIKRIELFAFTGTRIPKPEKPDLECATIIDNKLYVVGSGSLSPQRDVAFIVHLDEDKVKRISTAAFYALFRDRNLVAEMNIEGFTDCKDKLLFFNRANTQQANQLLITDHKIIKKQFPDKFKVLPVEIANLRQLPLGISGACYDDKNDILFLSASAENTSNAYDDGEIEGSAIGVVFNAYQKLNDKKYTIDKLICLDDVHQDFQQQKIESICILRQSNNTYRMAMVADNDDGKSVLFEVEITL